MSMTTTAQTLHDFTLENIDGDQVSLSTYAGKVVLVVNVASFCGFTRQYADLQKLYKDHEADGLVILGIPANDFGAQEPGTNEEIKEFCATKFDITFPLFSKVTVKGKGMAPLYAWLTSGGGNDKLAGDVRWNFEKFLVGKDGVLRTRYASNIELANEDLVTALEKALAE